jgi:hypothetical protein
LHSQLGYSQFCIVTLLSQADYKTGYYQADYKTGYYQADYTKLDIAKMTIQSWL